MKNILILTLLFLISGLAYSQNDTINIGTAPNNGTGDSFRASFIKVNRAVRAVDSLKTEVRDTISFEVQEITDVVTIHVGDTTVTALTGRIVFKTSDKHFYGCRQTNTSYRKWFQLEDLPGLTYYVSNSGSDANTGLSPATAWQTIAKVNATTLTLGTTVCLNRGDQWREQLTIGQSGTLTNKITFTAYGTGAKPIINGADIITGWADEAGDIWSINSPNLTTSRCVVVVDDTLFTQVSALVGVVARTYFIDVAATPDKLYIHSVANPDTRVTEVSKRNYGIRIDAKTDITLSYLDVRNSGTQGIMFDGVSSSVRGRAVLDSIHVYRNRIHGVAIMEGYSDVIVQNSEGSYNGNNFMAWGNQGAGNGSEGVHCSNILFKNLTSSYAIRDYIMTGSYTDGSGIQLFNSDGVIEHCTSDYEPHGIYLDPWGNACTQVARYNSVKNGTYASSEGIGIAKIGTGGYVSVYYNLVVNCGGQSQGVINSQSNNTGNIYIYNNTIYVNDLREQSSGIRIAYGVNHTVKNNIIYFPTSYGDENYRACLNIADAGATVSDYNHFFHGATDPDYIVKRGASYYTNLAAWRAVVSQDLNSSEGDPSFMAPVTFNVVLKEASPCIDKGTVIVGIPQVDILGHPIVGLPDMGCFEKQ